MSTQLTVVDIEWVSNTTNGNAVWRFRFTNGMVATTKPNAGFAGEVWPGMVDKTFDFDFDMGGRITGMTPV